MTWTRKIWALLAICTLALVICGCGNDDEGQQAPSQEQSAAPSGTERTAPAAAPSVPTAAGGPESAMPSPPEVPRTAEQIEAVAADALKDMLPASLPGMERTDASAERNSMTGVDMTTANARYETSSGGSISITITDVGDVSGPMRTSMAAWAVVEYNRQTDAGYEKSGTYGGFKGMEEYDRENRCGAIRVFVADRFVVEVEGNSVTMDAVQEALSRIDLKRMAGLGSGS